MFTGIVEELGTVVAVAPLEAAARVTIRGPLVTSDAVHGASIAVNGVCLTVIDDEVVDGCFSADVMQESLDRTGLGSLRPGDPVNLERPVTLSARLGGHLVQGHVDGVGTVIARRPSENWDVVTVALPRDLARYVVEKGSITVDGVSLTVSALAGDPKSESGHTFSVSLIPTTLAMTTLGRRAVGDQVNLEVDVMAKYAERLAAFGNPEEGS